MWSIMRASLALFILASNPLASNPASAQGDDLVGSWRQTHSTAGQCPDCSITIRPAGDGYVVSSSNGWSGRLFGERGGASGRGEWNTSGAWNGPLRIRVRAHDGELELSLTAEWSGASLSSSYVAMGRERRGERGYEREGRDGDFGDERHFGRERGHSLFGVWRQTYSDAGECPSCVVTIRPAGDEIEISSNNGWSAMLREGPDGSSGRGAWPTHGAWGGPLFVRLRLRDGRLQLSMTSERSGAALTAYFER